MLEIFRYRFVFNITFQLGSKYESKTDKTINRIILIYSLFVLPSK